MENFKITKGSFLEHTYITLENKYPVNLYMFDNKLT